MDKWSNLTIKDHQKTCMELENQWDIRRKELFNSDMDWNSYVKAVNTDPKFKEYNRCFESLVKKYTPENAEENGIEVKPLETRFGDLIPAVDFKEACKCKGFTDDDGSGYYSDGTNEYRIPAYPSSFYYNNENRNFTHVMWYNK